MADGRRRPVRTRREKIVLGMAVGWAAALALLSLGILVPSVPGVGVVVGVLVAGFTAHTVIAALAGFAWAVAAARRGAPALARTVAAVAAVSTVVACIPFVALWRDALDRGFTPSLLAHLRGGYNGGALDPSRSMPYDRVEGGDLLLDVWMPEDGSASPRPAVVWVHGGGWVGGRRSTSQRWNRWFNQRGYAVFDVDYRLSPPPRWDTAPGDVRCAVRWVKANADRFGVDPDRVVLAGESAGAHLALLAAYRPGDQLPGRRCGGGTDGTVAAVVAMSAPTDLATLWADPDVSRTVRRWIETFEGGPPAAVHQRYLATSAQLAVVGARRVPATLLVHGTRDHGVPFAQSAALAAALDDAGAPHELVDLPYTDHGFGQFWSSLPTQIARHEIGRFLRTLVPVTG